MHRENCSLHYAVLVALSSSAGALTNTICLLLVGMPAHLAAMIEGRQVNDQLHEASSMQQSCLSRFACAASSEPRRAASIVQRMTNDMCMTTTCCSCYSPDTRQLLGVILHDGSGSCQHQFVTVRSSPKVLPGHT